jgi:hypothetical protein
MDLVGAIVNLQTSKALGEVQLRAARKILDEQQLQGSAAVKLIEAAGNGINQAGDALAAQATGLGGLLDLHA